MFVSTFNDDRQFMLHVAHGEVSASDILVATSTWFRHEKFNPTYPVVWDLNDCRLVMSMEDMRSLYPQVREKSRGKKRAGGRTAWAHPSALIRAMIDVVRAEFDWGSEWKTFADVESATDWCLGSDVVVSLRPDRG